MNLQRHSVWDVTLPVSARWLVKHWNRADVPRPPQQPGDPQVKTEPRRGVNQPSPLRQGGRLQPLDSSSPASPAPVQTIFSCSPSATRQQRPLTLRPPFSPSAEKNIWFPLRSKQTQLQPQQHLQPPTVLIKRTVTLSVCPVTSSLSSFFWNEWWINLPGRRSVWRVSSRTGSLWNTALQQNSAAAPFVEQLTLPESVGSPEGLRGITSNTSSESFIKFLLHTQVHTYWGYVMLAGRTEFLLHVWTVTSSLRSSSCGTRKASKHTECFHHQRQALSVWFSLRPGLNPVLQMHPGWSDHKNPALSTVDCLDDRPHSISGGHARVFVNRIHRETRRRRKSHSDEQSGLHAVWFPFASQ